MHYKRLRSLLLLFVVAMVGTDAHADTCTLPDPDAPWTLVFGDEFDGDELDRSRWNTEFLWGPGVVINRERQYYVNTDDERFTFNPFRVADGLLSIRAIKREFDRSKLYLTRSIYSDTAAELLWRVPAGATHYAVYRNGEYVGTASGGAWFEPDLRAGIDYAFEVVALDVDEVPIVTEQITINTADRVIPTPRRPFSLELVSLVYSDSSAEISWRVPTRAGSYEIRRNGEVYRLLPTGGYSSLYEDSLEAGVDYTYEVIAYDRCGETIIRDTITVNTETGVKPPATVQRLVISANISSERTVELSWTAVAGAVAYSITDNGAPVGTIDGRSLFIDDMEPGFDRKFHVKALDAQGVVLDETSRTINTADNSFAMNRQAFLSGIITSYDAFRFRYGRVEMRARLPAGKGLWSAFWLLNAYYNDDEWEDPEIDIVEGIGDEPYIAHQAYHWQDDANFDGVSDTRVTTEMQAEITHFAENFHVYSVEWSEGLLIYKIDGEETGRIEGDSVSSEQMYVIANLALGGLWAGEPDASTLFPASMDIDYIRVYQRL